MLRPKYFPSRHARSKFRLSEKRLLFLSLSGNVVFMWICVSWLWQPRPSDVIGTTHVPKDAILAHAMKWNGGHPIMGQTGSCMCSPDKYCLCSPSLAIDLVMSVAGSQDIWVVRRRDTNQLACMGGFVQVGETVEQAVARELQEETGLSLNREPILLGVYSDPRRDKRRHTVSAVYAVELDENDRPVAADDVKDVIKIPLSKIEDQDFFADHLTILTDYRRWRADKRTTSKMPSVGDFAEDIARSICNA